MLGMSGRHCRGPCEEQRVVDIAGGGAMRQPSMNGGHSPRNVPPQLLRRHVGFFAALLLVSAVALLEGVLILHGIPKENRVYNACLLEGGDDGRLSGRTLRRCSIVRRGGSTRCKTRDVSLRPDPLPLRIYQQYDNTSVHPWLYDGTSDLYRGLAQVPGVIRPDMQDVDASLHLDILKDSFYQNQLCEYSGFFALLAGGFLKAQPEPYIGFQSQRQLRENRMALQCDDEAALVSSVDDHVRKGLEAFYFWASPSPRLAKTRHGDELPLFWGCDMTEAPSLQVIKAGFSTLFGNNPPEGLENGLPPMPNDGEEWAHMSYFAMPTVQFERYLRFAALFFAALEDKFYDNFSFGKCPRYNPNYSMGYQGQHCYCCIMERLVNIWVFHSGLPMLFLDIKTGIVREVHAQQQRNQSKALLAWFSDANIRSLKFDIANLLARRNGRRVVEQLLPREFAFALDGLEVVKYTVRDKLSRREGKKAVEKVLVEVTGEAKAASA